MSDTNQMANADNAQAGQQPQPKYITAPEYTTTEVYADGIFGITMRNATARISTFSVVGVDEKTNTELRRINHHLILPQVGLNELASILQRMAQAIRQAQEQQATQGQATTNNNPITT